MSEVCHDYKITCQCVSGLIGCRPILCHVVMYRLDHQLTHLREMHDLHVKKDKSNARTKHLLVFSINNNPMSKCYQRVYKCFDARFSGLPSARADNVLCTFYLCDLTTSGIKLENLKVP